MSDLKDLKIKCTKEYHELLKIGLDVANAKRLEALTNVLIKNNIISEEDLLNEFYKEVTNENKNN